MILAHHQPRPLERLLRTRRPEMAAAPQNHGRGEKDPSNMCIVVVSENSRNRRRRNIRFAVGESVDGKGEQVCIFVLRADLIDLALTSMLPKEVRLEARRMGAMLGAGSHSPAGLLIQLGSTEQMIEEMKSALFRVYHETAQRRTWANNARNAALKFNMDDCAAAYLSIYNLALRDRDEKGNAAQN